MQRVEINLFDRDHHRVVPILPTSSLRLSHTNPIGGLVTRAFEPISFHKGLDQMDRMAVFFLPIRRKTSKNGGQDMAGQMRDLHPGENQKAGVVRDEVQVLPSHVVLPTNEAISGLGLPGGGPEKEAGEIASLLITDKIRKVLSNRPVKAQIVMGGQVGSKAPLLWSAGTEQDFERT